MPEIFTISSTNSLIKIAKIKAKIKNFLLFIIYILICRQFYVDTKSMEIINYFESTQYDSNRKIKFNFNIEEVFFEFKQVSIRGIELITKYKLVVFFVLIIYSLLLMIPFIQETNYKFFKTIEFSTVNIQEANVLNLTMEQFAMTGSLVKQEEDILQDDIGVLLPQIIQPVTYSTYKVRRGDNITNIAKRFGLANISTLIAVNEISNVRLLQSGQTLKIPSMDGIIHKVATGENLNTIAQKYSITLENLLDANDLSSSVIQKGTVLFIPGAKLDSSSLRDAMGESFKMPVKAKWRLTSPYGYRADPFTGQRKFHTGIDMAAPLGTKIYAAMAGKVATTGFNNVFGNYVIISHGNGYQSLYAHLQKYTVRAGQFIDQGAQLGLMGSTGYSTGSHLHLSIYKNGKHINPAPLLK